MGVAESGESELIRVSVVDYFSCTVLLDSLVWPEVKMSHYNTAFSGVTTQAMEGAMRRDRCIMGRNRARQAVCDFVGPDTIVVGHGAHQDLTSLRWIHPNIVDTLLVETLKRSQGNATEGTARGDGISQQAQGTNAAGGLSLKALALQRLNRRIQLRRKGHDSTEDAITTRDLLHWHVTRAVRSEESLTSESGG